MCLKMLVPFTMSLFTFKNLIQRTSHKHAWKVGSWVFLAPVKLIIHINKPRWGLYGTVENTNQEPTHPISGFSICHSAASSWLRDGAHSSHLVLIQEA